MVQTARRILLGILLALLAVTALAAQPVRIVAVQMKVNHAFYRDAGSFYRSMDRIVGQAARYSVPGVPTLIALPEDVGLGLIFLDAWETVEPAATMQEAGYLLGQSLLGDVYQQYAEHGDELAYRYFLDGYSLEQITALMPTHLLLLAVNERPGGAYDTYYATFSSLALKYGVYLAAGSAPLVVPGTSYVQNRAVLFGPDGAILNETAKVHLMDIERYLLTEDPGDMAALSVVTTPFGTVGTAVCLDGFYVPGEDVLTRLTELGADIILQPSFNPQVWDTAQEDEWQAEGLWGRLTQGFPSVRAGVNPMMTGRLFDILVQGRTNAVSGSAADGYLGRVKTGTETAFLVVDLPG